MTSKEHIEVELKKFIKQFSQVKIRYEFHEMANTHFIEVLPYGVYSSDSYYISWENAMRVGFIKLYPTEGICFISDDTAAGIENAELTLFGKAYSSLAGKKRAAARA